jgi:hypothetical protein
MLMELDYEKDVKKILGLLEYEFKRYSYEYEDILRNATIDDPWITSYLSLDELKEFGITEARAEQLFFGVCRKQSLAPYDFMNSEVKQITLMSGDTDVADIHTMKKSDDGKYLMFPVVYWISDVIKKFDNNELELKNPELLTKHLDANNTIILDGLTGKFSYNKKEGILKKRKLQLLRALLKSKDNSVSYDEMAKMFFDADKYNKVKHSKAFTDVLDDLKRDMGVLPKTDTSNPNCFENITLSSYRLTSPK